MTKAAVTIESNLDSTQAGKNLGLSILAKLEGKKPHAVLVFCSAQHDYSAVLKAIQDTCSPEHLVGCSSAGEFTHADRREGSISAIGIWSDKIKFSSGVGRNVQENPERAADELISTFTGIHHSEYRYHTAIVLADALVGYTEDFVKALTVKTLGKYQFAGGGAGDDGKFLETHVFYGTEPIRGGVVALEILSNEPVGVGVKHGWEVASSPFRVTESVENRLYSLNGTAAVNVFKDYAATTNQKFELENPIPFFLHNVLGIETPAGYKLRCPLSLHEDGSISCASAIPSGAVVSIMRTSTESAAKAAVSATEKALSELHTDQPSVGIFFDCAATRLRLGVDFGTELDAVAARLNGVEFIGCNTYGQIVRAEGQFNGFHNCTAVTCLLP